MGAELELMRSGVAIESYPLSIPEITIGRNPSHHLAFTDPTVSRNHARFSSQGGSWFVSDLGSTHGTLVNGNRIGSPVQLQNGDIIQIGGNLLRFADAATALDPTRAISGGSAPNQTLPPPFYAQPDPQPPIPGQMYPPPGYPPRPMQQELLFAQKPQIPSWIWIVVALVVMGPCGILTFGALAIALMPFAMALGGVVAAIVGWQMYSHYRSYPGWEAQANKGFVLGAGGLVAAVLGVIWIGAGWLAPTSRSWSPRSSSSHGQSIEFDNDSLSGNGGPSTANDAHSQQEILAGKWSTNLGEAVQAAATTHRKIFVDFMASWCGPCKMLQNEVLDTPDFQNLAKQKQLILCRIDTDRYPELMVQHHFKAIPCQEVLDENGNVLSQKVGYGSPDGFYSWLDSVL
ncbi:MAG TPA: FHA domain-containing protein [Fimbriimonas sp.]|nr:FHA domain-containing protein [Fimbriimonas sp.]